MSAPDPNQLTDDSHAGSVSRRQRLGRRSRPDLPGQADPGDHGWLLERFGVNPADLPSQARRLGDMFAT